MMRWLAMQWRDCTTKCSSGNISPRCPRNLLWLRKLAAHGNCWSGRPNCGGWRAKNLAEASVCGRRAGKVERRGRDAGTESEHGAAAEPQTEARRSCGTAPCKLVTSARFEKWNGRRREPGFALLRGGWLRNLRAHS